MKKRALMILMICILGSAAMPGPAFYALAATTDGGAGETGREKDGGILDKGSDLGGELYQKMDEALDRFDKEALRRNIREALREMDEMGVSPSVVAEKTLGLKTSPALRGQTPGDTLIKDAHNVVRKKTDGFFTVLWNGFLDTLEGLIETGFNLAAGGKDTRR